MSTQPPIPPNAPGRSQNSQVPTPPPAEKSNVLMWVLAGVGVVVIFGVLSVLFIVRALVHTHLNVSQSGNSVVIDTPRGTLSVNSGKPDDLGLPIYPGATPQGEAGDVQFTGANDQRAGVGGATYTTTDSMEQVEAWYAGQLGSAFQSEGPGPKTIYMHGMKVQIDDGEFAYISDRDNALSIVGLKPRAGRVEIALARIGRGRAQ